LSAAIKESIDTKAKNAENETVSILANQACDSGPATPRTA
jgi:hypothetical protein